MRPTPDTSQPRIGLLPEGASPDYNCFAYGQTIGGVDVWFSVNYNGETGYYASYYDDSSYQSETELTTKYGVPKCSEGQSEDGGSSSSPPPGGESSSGASAEGGPEASPPQDNSLYDRSAAVAWALEHAGDPQPRTAMCAWFVSHALWAGGFPKTSDWTDQGSYGYTASGTAAEWQVGPLLSYIEDHYSYSWSDITPALRTNAVPDAQPGDVLVYDWGQGEGDSHVALVVGIASDDYPEVAEMGQYDFNVAQALANRVVHVSSPYSERGWTWSELHHEWLQQEYPDMQVHLLHINGGFFASSY